MNRMKTYNKRIRLNVVQKEEKNENEKEDRIYEIDFNE